MVSSGRISVGGSARPGPRWVLAGPAHISLDRRRVSPARLGIAPAREAAPRGLDRYSRIVWAGNRGGRWFAGVAVGLAVVAGSGRAEAARRPDPLPDESGCTHYRGTASGNDTSTRLDVVLCPHDDGTQGKVRGKVQWSSLSSGWNVRRVQGQWTDDRLALRDLEIIQERPENGYYFCEIDTYALDRNPDGKLAGSYDSAACNDHATVTLTPLRAIPAEASDPAQTDQGSGRVPAKTPAADPSAPATSTGASAGGSAGGCGGCDVALSACLLPLIGFGSRRRRNAG